MTFDRDAYEVLQVRPEAQQVVIVAALPVVARPLPPDRDGSAGSKRRMAGLNDAYAKVRTADRRAVYDKARQLRSSAPAAVVTPHSAPATDGVSSGSLDFGRYAGWTVSQIAKQDLDYLRWLSRHSSGLRFRPEIDRVLRERPATAER